MIAPKTDVYASTVDRLKARAAAYGWRVVGEGEREGEREALEVAWLNGYADAVADLNAATARVSLN